METSLKQKMKTLNDFFSVFDEDKFNYISVFANYETRISGSYSKSLIKELKEKDYIFYKNECENFDSNIIPYVCEKDGMIITLYEFTKK
jgi:hypothetical protein